MSVEDIMEYEDTEDVGEQAEENFCFNHITKNHIKVFKKTYDFCR